VANDESNALGILWGAAAIGHFIGKDRRKTYWLLENKLLPGRKKGKVWISTKAELTADFTSGGASNQAQAAAPKTGSPKPARKPEATAP
jgi:hypothetical protein